MLQRSPLHLQADLQLRLQALPVQRGDEMTIQHPLPLPPPYRPDKSLIGHMEESQKGWGSLPFVPADGQHWPLKTAAELLDIPEQDLRDLVRIIENIKGESIASGVIKANSFARSGRQPKAYPGSKLVDLCEGLRRIAESL
jgi:hypothetical protein